jgi:glutamate synthase domain-containing protein 3
MAGGRLILLGMHQDGKPIVGNYVGSGMHGGTIYIRGHVENYQLGKEVGVREIDDRDQEILTSLLTEYANALELDINELMSQEFIKLVPVSHRPYGNLYAY